MVRGIEVRVGSWFLGLPDLAHDRTAAVPPWSTGLGLLVGEYEAVRHLSIDLESGRY